MDYTKKLTDTAKETISGADMLTKATKGVLCGFSGGSDSLCLTHFLAGYCKAAGIKLLAAHINHGIRGEEADSDQRFCETFCEKLGIPFVTVKLDVPALAAKTGQTLEEAARNARYAAFEQICAEYGADTVATAHNARDNAETVVFSLIRGTSTHGIAGIPPVRRLGESIKVVRPLLYCPKEWILGYDAENSLEYVTDSTNSDVNYTRNFIRLKILPMFAEINPSYETSAADFTRLVRADDEFLTGASNDLYDSLFAEKTVSSAPLLSKIALTKRDDALLSRALIRRYSEYSDKTLEKTHVDAMLGAIHRQRGSVSLPGRLKLSVDGGTIQFLRDEKTRDNAAADYDKSLMPGLNVIEGTPFAVYAVFGALDDIIRKDIKQHINIYKLFIHAFASSDKIIGNVKFRNRRAGDKITILGTRKDVRRLMNEHRIPLDYRASLPVFYDSEGIVCAGGFAVCDRIFVSEKERDTADFHLFILHGQNPF